MRVIYQNSEVTEVELFSNELLGLTLKSGKRDLISHCDQTNVLTIINRYIVCPNPHLSYKDINDYKDCQIKHNLDRVEEIVSFGCNFEALIWLANE